MTSVTIEEIIQKLLDVVDVEPAAETEDVDKATREALAGIREVIEGVIGKDDNQKRSGPMFKPARNGLRAEQRARLSKVMGGENGDSK